MSSAAHAPRGRPATFPAALLEAAQRGERPAIAELLAVSQSDIRRYARMSCRVDHVDDAVQDVLWIVARRVSALRAVAAFSSWLFETVRRECLRLARRARSGDALVPVDTLADDLRLSARPEPEILLDIAAAIESLPAHYRAVLMLRDVEERTIDEIARALETSRETVKARLHRARAMVREYLKD